MTRALIPLALTATAGFLLFLRLDEPGRIIFDETYYVNDAREYLKAAVEASFAVHPPVGKWIIAASITLFGDTSLGWRMMGAFAGAAMVLLTYLMGVRLFARRGAAALAALLLMTDGLFFVQARTGMLDIYLGLFVALGAWLLLVDYQRTGLAPPEPARRVLTGRALPAGGSSDQPPPWASSVERPPTDGAVATADRDEHATLASDHRDTIVTREVVRAPRTWHGLRILAGVAFGLGAATKWSGLLALGAAGLLSLIWEFSLRRRVARKARSHLPRAIASITIALVLVPSVTYLASYIPWLVAYPHTTEGVKECGETAEEQAACEVGLAGRLAGLGRYHQAIATFHENLEAEHTYRAPAYTWPVMARPVVYYYENCTENRFNQVQTTEDDGTVTTPKLCVVEQGQAGEIIALGNPALWWGFLGASILLAAGLGRRDRRAWFISVFWLAQFLPWLVVSRPVFFFYMVPNVVFLALGVAYATATLSERQPILAPLVGAAAGAGLGFTAGLGLEATLNGGVGIGRWIGLGVGMFVGAMIGGALADRRRRRRGDLDPSARVAAQRARIGRFDVGQWAAVGFAVAAVGLFLFFYPVWTGIPLSDDVIRWRWWIRPGWI